MMKPDLEIREENGYTPLHTAVLHIDKLDCVEIVQSLVLKGANRSAKSSDGKTPLELLSGLDIDQGVKSDAQYVLKNSKSKYSSFPESLIQFPKKSPGEDASDQVNEDDDGDDVIELCSASKDFAERHVALLLHKIKAKRQRLEAKRDGLNELLRKVRSEV